MPLKKIKARFKNILTCCLKLQAACAVLRYAGRALGWVAHCCVLLIAFYILPYACFASEPPRYEIIASIDTLRHKIKAQEKIVFTNNSQKDINQIYLHIYPHRKYTKKEIRFMYRYAGYFKVNPFPEGFQSGDLKIVSVFSKQQPLSYAIENEDRTILAISPGLTLKPGDSIELTIGFEVEIPHSYGRFGWHKDIITLVRWYPILSVLDNAGWHNYPFYIYHQPYFSDAAYYTVQLTLPDKEGVVHTGSLRGETLNPDGTKTLKIETEAPVRDFGLGISSNFMAYTFQEHGLKVNSYYLRGGEGAAKDAAQCALTLIRFYAKRFGAYPYKEFNIVPSYLGYGGVQSSGLIFIDTRVYKLPGFLKRYFDFLIAHETGHQWFYNIIGSDEYREMFLDEGMNSYWLLQYLEDKYGPDAKVMDLPKSLKWLLPNFSFRDSTIARYIYMAKNGLDRSIIGELSSFQEPSSIFALAYSKGAAVVRMLRSHVGSDIFDKIMQRYTNEFRFKNISLEEFMEICNQESGRDLNWFFQDWLKTSKTCDYAIKSVNPKRVILENRGAIPMPVKTKITYKDGTEDIRPWEGKEKIKTIPLERSRQVKSIEIDPENAIVLDLVRTNNYWPRNLYFKPVPLYFFAYDVPVFLPRNSYNLVFGPQAGASSLGAAASLQKPDDNILRITSSYDFNGKAHNSTLGYEFSHVFNKQTALGFEVFNYASRKEGRDLSGGKIYLRRELWPANYGLLDLNDHLSLYLIRDQKLENTSYLNGREDINHLYYRKKNEAIFGITASLGRYGPYPDPDYGWRFMPTQEFAGHFLGGKEAFWRTTLELNNYYLILPRYQHKIATRLKFGWGGPSEEKLFQLGGPDGLRGYSRKTIEGAHMILGGMEYRFPLISDLRLYFADNIFCLDKIQAAAFFDAGKAWRADFSGRGLKKDAGLGLRLHFGIMGFLEKVVLRVDIAQALNEHKEKPHLWFGISHSF